MACGPRQPPEKPVKLPSYVVAAQHRRDTFGPLPLSKQGPELMGPPGQLFHCLDVSTGITSSTAHQALQLTSEGHLNVFAGPPLGGTPRLLPFLLGTPRMMVPVVPTVLGVVPLGGNRYGSRL